MSVHTQIKQDWEKAIRDALLNRLNDFEPELLDAEFIHNPDDIIRDSRDFRFKIHKGSLGVKNMLKNLGLKKCLNRDAEFLILTGKCENNCWYNSKNIWVKRSVTMNS